MHSLFYRIAIVLYILLYISTYSFSQGTNVAKLGLDNRLYNGRYYTYFVSKDIKGNQFLKSKNYSNGKVWKNDAEFKNIFLNFDVYNQDLVLKFDTREGATKLIIVSKTYLDSFYLDNRMFVIDKTIDNEFSIFQKVEHNGIKFLMHKYKELVLISKLNEIQHQFTKVKSLMYFVDENKSYAVTRNKHLLNIVDKKNEKGIKEFLKSHKYRIQNMSDDQLLELLVFIKEADNEN